MGRLRWPLMAILALLLLLDGVFAFRMYDQGYHALIQDSTRAFRVETFPHSRSDYLFLGILLAVHAAVLYGVWRS